MSVATTTFSDFFQFIGSNILGLDAGSSLIILMIVILSILVIRFFPGIVIIMIFTMLSLSLFAFDWASSVYVAIIIVVAAGIILGIAKIWRSG